MNLSSKYVFSFPIYGKNQNHKYGANENLKRVKFYIFKLSEIRFKIKSNSNEITLAKKKDKTKTVLLY